MTADESPAGLLRRAADLIDTQTAATLARDWTYVALTPDGEEWGALLSPHVAAPLAAWLRHTANAVWTYPPFLDEWQGGGDGEYHAGEAAKAALTLARSLLGEDQP